MTTRASQTQPSLIMESTIEILLRTFNEQCALMDNRCDRLDKRLDNLERARKARTNPGSPKSTFPGLEFIG